jgi:hypothetical protein
MNVYRTLAGRRERRTTISKWVDNIKMDIWEMGRHGKDWIVLAENRDWWRALMNMVINLRVP